MAEQNDPLTVIFKPAWLGKVARKSASDKEIKDAAEQMGLDASYERNGWTPETLAVYFKERHEASTNFALHRRPARPKRTKGWHNAHRWRK